MIEILRQTLALILFEGAEQPLALLEETAVEQRQQALPENCQVHIAPSSAAYVAELQKLLAQAQPTCLFLMPPLIPPISCRKGYKNNIPVWGYMK